jgi:arylsulfatase A-like enzyme
MPKGTQTFPQLLQKADCKTAFIGKWHMGEAVPKLPKTTGISPSVP